MRPPFGPRQQFEAGRHAAAAALERAGATERQVPRAADGRPCFSSGFAGSIAHTDHMAVAVVVPGAVSAGIDIEDAVITPRVARFILRDGERHMLLPPTGPYTPRELFAAKEAAFKALSEIGTSDDFLFWRVGLKHSDGALLACFRGVPVPVWVNSDERLSLAVAIRR